MKEINHYNRSNPPEQELVEFDPVRTAGEAQMQFDIASFVLRRWWIVLLLAIPIWAAGISYIYFKVPKVHETTGAVEIAPIVAAILYSDQDSERPLPNYDGFKNTQAAIMKSDKVMSRVANELKDRNLPFFEGSEDYLLELRQAVSEEIISIQPQRQTNLVTIQMTSPHPSQSEVIINSIIRNYMDIAVQDQMRGDDTKLGILENERKQLEAKLERQQETIRQLIEEYGTDELSERQNLEFARVADLQREMSTVDIRRMALDSQIKALEGQEPASTLETNWIQLRNQIISSDPTLQALRQDIRRYEELVAVGNRTLAKTNPELIQREQVLATLKERHDERHSQVIAELETSLKKEQEIIQQQKMEELQSELDYLISYQNLLQEKIQNQDAQTILLGRKQFMINDQRQQLTVTAARLKEIDTRINELMIESKRPARISVGFEAQTVPGQGKRKKMAAAVGFGGLALGGAVALLIHLRDKRLHRPQEVVNRVGVRILGTTTSPNSINRHLLAQQLNDDYQTIRANLGLLDGKGGSQVILVSSPGIRDGKTTFSINLATSFAQAGRSTLLLDGDLRKPDIAMALGLSMDLRGLQDYLFGKDLSLCAVKMEGLNLHVLASDFRNASDALNLIAHPQTADRVRALKKSYDVIVIDSPPVLAFADSLVWSKMADNVILTSFLGHTSQEEIREAVRRLEDIGANVLGTVVNNVKVEHGYRRYGYGYGYGYGYSDRSSVEKMQKSNNRKRRNSLILNMPLKEGEEVAD